MTWKSQPVIGAPAGQAANSLQLMGNLFNIAETDGGLITQLQNAFRPGMG